jgi:hypothetical protein
MPQAKNFNVKNCSHFEATLVGILVKRILISVEARDVMQEIGVLPQN